MNIVVKEDLKAYIDPLTQEEHDALERSLLAEGCRDALVLWGDILVDGHNRHGICMKHGIPFKTVQNTRFKTIEDVHLWMIDQHLGRRSVSDFQRGVLALRKKEIIEKALAEFPAPAPVAAAEEPPVEGVPPHAAAPSAPLPPPAPPLKSREDIAKAARLSSSQVVMIEKIQKQAAPELVAAVKSGTISLNAAAAVASLPTEEQVAAVEGGKDELKQAAKRVREAKQRKPQGEEGGAEGAPADELATLRQRVAELTAENESLRAELAQLRGG